MKTRNKYRLIGGGPERFLCFHISISDFNYCFNVLLERSIKDVDVLLSSGNYAGFEFHFGFLIWA